MARSSDIRTFRRFFCAADEPRSRLTFFLSLFDVELKVNSILLKKKTMREREMTAGMMRRNSTTRRDMCGGNKRNEGSE